jgi:hypothetical protein
MSDICNFVSEFLRTPYVRSSQNTPYSITYAERLAEHCSPGAFEQRKGYKGAQNTLEGSQKWAGIVLAERDNAKRLRQ